MHHNVHRDASMSGTTECTLFDRLADCGSTSPSRTVDHLDSPTGARHGSIRQRPPPRPMGRRHRTRTTAARPDHRNGRPVPAVATVRQDPAGREPLRPRRDRTDADERRDHLRLQVRQRPPDQLDPRPADGHRIRRARRRRHRLSDHDLGDDAAHRAPHRCDLGDGRQGCSRPPDATHHGDDRLGRTVRVPGARHSAPTSGINTLRVFDIDPAAMAKFERNAIGARLRRDAVRRRRTCDHRRRDHHDLHRRQAQRDDPHRRDGRSAPARSAADRTPHQRDRRRLPGQDRTRHRTRQARHRSSSSTPSSRSSRARSSSSRTTGRSPNCGRCSRARRPVAASDDEITIFDSVGFAIEDFAALTFLNDRLDGTDYYDEIDLVAEPERPEEPVRARRRPTSRRGRLMTAAAVTVHRTARTHARRCRSRRRRRW